MWRMIGYNGRTWVAHFWFVGWWSISFGIHVGLNAPNIEIHLPFGFLRVGRQSPPVEAIVIHTQQ